jgi:hypothetical protein
MMRQVMYQSSRLALIGGSPAYFRHTCPSLSDSGHRPERHVFVALVSISSERLRSSPHCLRPLGLGCISASPSEPFVPSPPIYSVCEAREIEWPMGQSELMFVHAARPGTVGLDGSMLDAGGLQVVGHRCRLKMRTISKCLDRSE